MIDFIVDTESGFNDLVSMVNTGTAKILSLNNNIANVSINKKVIKIELEQDYFDALSGLSSNKRGDPVAAIINGKDNTQRVVNISIKDDTVFIFKEINNKVIYDKVPYKHWVLSHNDNKGFTALKGNQYYKYIKEYTLAEYNRVKQNVYKLGLYTINNQQEAFMVKNGHTYFKGMKTHEVSLLSFDIETTGLDPNRDDAEVLLITNTFRKNAQLIKKTFCLEDYDNQFQMITSWSKWVREVDPSLLIGHNVIIFDLPYIKTIMDKENLPLLLGRFDENISVDDRNRELRVDGSQTYSYKRINIFGREIIDTFFLAIKADIAKKYESYRLKSIIAQEGLEKPGRVHYDASKIKENWHIPEERKKIIAYGEDDSEDPIKLFDLMVAPFFYLTPHIPKPFQMMIESATGSQINSLMIRSYLQEGYSVAKAEEITSFEGAISFGNVGIYDNVFKVDVASLYPSIMRHYKIYPKNKDFNGNFLKMLDHFTIERFKNKKLAKDTGDRYYKDLEQAQKVVINSAYGFMGANGLNYNFGQGASDVTKYGREIITKAVEWASGSTLKKVIKHISNKGKENELVEYEWALGEKVSQGRDFSISNCDTDSISFTTGRELTENERLAILEDLNSQFPSAIKFEDDGFFKRVIILKAKNYILFDGKNIKLKGSSLKDKKKEPALKEMLDRMIHCLVFNSDELLSIYNSYILECLNVVDISRWATKKTVSKAILKCATDPNARLNERKVYDAIKDTPIQEGDKVYLYPAILDIKGELITLKNGKIKEKIYKSTGLKRIDQWNNDHDVDKLIERVVTSVDILANVMPGDLFIDYTLVKNKNLLDNFKKVC